MYRVPQISSWGRVDPLETLFMPLATGCSRTYRGGVPRFLAKSIRVHPVTIFSDMSTRRRPSYSHAAAVAGHADSQHCVNRERCSPPTPRRSSRPASGPCRVHRTAAFSTITTTMVQRLQAQGVTSIPPPLISRRKRWHCSSVLKRRSARIALSLLQSRTWQTLTRRIPETALISRAPRALPIVRKLANKLHAKPDLLRPILCLSHMTPL